MYKVSVGIPAYNEEKNISLLLNALLRQKMSEEVMIQEVIVISDGSTDRTPQIIRDFSKKDPRIKAYHNNTRRGKAVVLNEIFEKAKGEILVLLDADVLLKDELVVNMLVTPFLVDPNVGLIGGNPTPLPPQTLVERTCVFKYHLIQNIITAWKSGSNYYAAQGRFIAVSSNFYKSLNIPNVVGTDGYIYLSCLKKGYKFIYARDAVIYFRSPSTIKDFISQRSRFEKAKASQSKIFGKIADKAEIPKQVFIKALLSEGFKRPIDAIFWIFLSLWASIRSLLTKNIPHAWPIAESTKKVR